MEQMDEDIELIWGVTFDNELENKVKITLIVTGFTSDVIPEFKELNDINKDTSENEIKKESVVDDILTKIRKPTTTLRVEDLDNLDLLEELENEPAIKRIKL